MTATDACMAGCPSDAVVPRCPSQGNGQPPRATLAFGAPVTITLPDGTRGQSAAIGDVTGDGRNDVVIGTIESTALYVLPQTANGQLGPAVTYTANAPEGTQPTLYMAAYATALGDVNGDNRLDVVIARFTDVAVLTQNAAGGLDPPRALPVSEVGSGVRAVAVADLNSDGRADIVSASWDTSALDVFFQRSDGTLSDATPFPCPHYGDETLAVGDVDGDGATDVVVAGQWAGFCILLQRPGGFATPPTTVAIADRSHGVGLGDFGLAECRGTLAYTTGGNSPNGKLGVLVPTPSIGFQPPMLLDTFDNPSDVVVRDVDGDGRPDVVVRHDGFTAVSVYRQLATGGLAPEQRFPFTYVNIGANRLAVGDINGDGRPDIVAADTMVTVGLQQ